MKWEEILPAFYQYLEFEKEFSKLELSCRKSLFKYLTRFLPLPFTITEVRALVVMLRQKKRLPGYVNNILTCINLFVRYCELIGQPLPVTITEINSIRPKENRTPDPNDLLSIEEIQKIITNPCREHPHSSVRLPDQTKYFQEVDSQYSLLFELLFKTAARSGEVLELRKRNFNFSNHSLTFYKTKTGDDRTIAIPPDMEDRIMKLCSALKDTEPLFKGHIHRLNSPVTQGMANRAFKTRCRLQGINRPCHIHMLRHSSISHMLINGCPLSVCQAICGHKRLATTQLYTHILIDNQREAMLWYNPLIKRNVDPHLVIERIKDFIKELKLSDDDRVKFSLTDEGKKLNFTLSID